jgi:mannose-1-phosphate guanylyltransferase
MNDPTEPWSIVLAAGEGTRLQSLTSDPAGAATPKQFCSLYGATTLLGDALRRAQAVSSPARIGTIVAAQHRRWWRTEVDDLCAENVFVQPENRGTANGILLPTLHIAARERDAVIVWLPSDHHVEDDAILANALRQAATEARETSGLLLLGIEPEEADVELGYVVPDFEIAEGLYTVDSFVEKPAPSVATRLLGRGALWNSFIFAATARALLELFDRRLPGLVDRMQHALARDGFRAEAGAALGAEYAEMRSLDFSRHVLAGAKTELFVKRVPTCGWSDLGTPRRLAATLERRPKPAPVPLDGAGVDRPCLAARHARQRAADATAIAR